MQQQHPGAVTHSRISSLLISRCLTRPIFWSPVYGVDCICMPAMASQGYLLYLVWLLLFYLTPYWLILPECKATKGWAGICVKVIQETSVILSDCVDWLGTCQARLNLGYATDLSFDYSQHWSRGKLALFLDPQSSFSSLVLFHLCTGRTWERG